MASSAATGTQTATLATEHTLATVTTAGVYQLQVDAANLANGETLTLKAKVKVTSTGTTRLCYEAVYKHAQGEPVKVSVPVPSLHEVVFTLQQDGGTGRAYPWEVVSL